MGTVVGTVDDLTTTTIMCLLVLTSSSRYFPMVAALLSVLSCTVAFPTGMIPDSPLNNYLPGRSRTRAALPRSISKVQNLFVFRSWNVPWDAMIASHHIFVFCHSLHHCGTAAHSAAGCPYP